MYKCWNCEAIFEEPVYKEFTEEYEAWGRNFTEKHVEALCPECGDDEFEEWIEEEEDEFI
ncbi:MAG: hypothetical protein WBL58_01605 [Peptococcia bacterium]